MLFRSVLAALAVTSGLPARKVSAFEVQRVLLADKSTLALEMFKDVSKDHPLWAAVEMAVAHEWIPPAGKETFGLDGVLNRGECAAILAHRFALTKAFNAYPAAPGEVATFTDVPLYHRYAADIEALYELGAIHGMGKLYRPGEPMRREDFREAMSKLLKLPANSVPVEEPAANITRGEAVRLLWEIH